jgi:catechol 2,3-dioxygenase-like lactoylglutathione lyase family enzyme
MYLGTHILFYSADADADRAFMRDILGWKGVDTGGGWIIFGMSPAEAGVHPLAGPRMPETDGQGILTAHVYLMCADLDAVMTELKAKGVEFEEVREEQWGMNTTLGLPSGGRLGIYQPYHPTALNS